MIGGCELGGPRRAWCLPPRTFLAKRTFTRQHTAGFRKSGGAEWMANSFQHRFLHHPNTKFMGFSSLDSREPFSWIRTSWKILWGFRSIKGSSVVKNKKHHPLDNPVEAKHHQATALEASVEPRNELMPASCYWNKATSFGWCQPTRKKKDLRPSVQVQEMMIMYQIAMENTSRLRFPFIDQSWSILQSSTKKQHGVNMTSKLPLHGANNYQQQPEQIFALHCRVTWRSKTESSSIQPAVGTVPKLTYLGSMISCFA